MTRILFGTSCVVALVAGCSATSSTPAKAPASPAPASSSAAPASPPVSSPPLAEKLASYLGGHFDSSEQAQRDPEFHNIVLHICPASAPALGREVVYVEQASADTLTQPYRQRLYVIDQDPADPAIVRSQVFELAKPADSVGLCDRAGQATFAATDAVERPGCTVRMKWTGTSFEGSTVGETCKSSLRGASYATTAVTVDKDGLHSWDRGFTSDGKQVWGAVKGGYEFVRRTPPPR